MYNHEPANYSCPFCLVVKGIENEKVDIKQSDIIFSSRIVTAFIGTLWWPNNPGHVVIIPNKHVENIYDLDIKITKEIHKVAKEVAIAFKRIYKAQGTSLNQHNEPAGNQEVWHYHVNIFPRYKKDNLYLLYDQKRKTTLKERRPFAEKPQKYFIRSNQRTKP